MIKNWCFREDLKKPNKPNQKMPQAPHQNKVSLQTLTKYFKNIENNLQECKKMKLPSIRLNKPEIRDYTLCVKLRYRWWRLKYINCAENSVSSVIPVGQGKQREKDVLFIMIP